MTDEDYNRIISSQITILTALLHLVMSDDSKNVFIRDSIQDQIHDLKRDLKPKWRG